MCKTSTPSPCLAEVRQLRPDRCRNTPLLIYLVYIIRPLMSRKKLHVPANLPTTLTMPLYHRFLKEVSQPCPNLVSRFSQDRPRIFPLCWFSNVVDNPVENRLSGKFDFRRLPGEADLAACPTVADRPPAAFRISARCPTDIIFKTKNRVIPTYFPFAWLTEYRKDKISIDKYIIAPKIFWRRYVTARVMNGKHPHCCPLAIQALFCYNGDSFENRKERPL